MEPQVTYVGDEDYAAVVKLLKENEIAGMPEEILTRGYSAPAAIKQRVQMGMETILVAKTGKDVLGLVVVALGVSDEIAAIPIILVAPENRRKGVASLLIGRAIEELRKTGARKVYANVHYRNRASMMLFTKMGFIPEVYMRDMYKMGDHVVVYAYSLEET